MGSINEAIREALKHFKEEDPKRSEEMKELLKNFLEILSKHDDEVLLEFFDIIYKGLVQSSAILFIDKMGNLYVSEDLDRSIREFGKVQLTSHNYKIDIEAITPKKKDLDGMYR